ncbi:hypothetical protein GQ457_14G022720 [Hibiscus cannabinus]
MTVIDDELTTGHELGSEFLGKAQGFMCPVRSMELVKRWHLRPCSRADTTSTHLDSSEFIGQTYWSHAHLSIMDSTGKYINARGFAIVKDITNE